MQACAKRVTIPMRGARGVVQCVDGRGDRPVGNDARRGRGERKNMDERVYWIWLQNAFGAGSAKPVQLVRRAGSAEALFRGGIGLWSSFTFVSDPRARRIERVRRPGSGGCARLLPAARAAGLHAGHARLSGPAPGNLQPAGRALRARHAAGRVGRCRNRRRRHAQGGQSGPARGKGDQLRARAGGGRRHQRRRARHRFRSAPRRNRRARGARSQCCRAGSTTPT